MKVAESIPDALSESPSGPGKIDEVTFGYHELPNSFYRQVLKKEGNSLVIEIQHLQPGYDLSIEAIFTVIQLLSEGTLGTSSVAILRNLSKLKLLIPQFSQSHNINAIREVLERNRARSEDYTTAAEVLQKSEEINANIDHARDSHTRHPGF